MTVSVHQSECLAFLSTQPDRSVDLVYVDPPFNTGRKQKGRRGSSASYEDSYDDYVGFLRPRMEEARRVLREDGSLFVHVDPRESHYVKVMLDGVFGRESFKNEIVWAYDYGGRSRRKWSSKHDVILWYAKDPENYTFNHDQIDRVPYMAPDLVGPEKAARGKTPTDVWWNTIVPTNGKERTGYPTQKPRAILDRIVKVHSKPHQIVMDFFAGSGTTGEAAAEHDRQAILVDQSAEACELMKRRLNRFLSPLDPARITDSFGAAVSAAVDEHHAAGRKVPVWRGGKIVYV